MTIDLNKQLNKVNVNPSLYQYISKNQKLFQPLWKLNNNKVTNVMSFIMWR